MAQAQAPLSRAEFDPELTIGRLAGEIELEFGRVRALEPRERWGWPAWLAVGFLLSVVAGVVRLGLGILAVGRLRARSLPITDAVLREEIECLRSELACTRLVETRESADVATPATFGWRRPVLILPFDWRDWDRSDRRAVLAHELAHVRRGDFLTSMVAQVSLALHFYHPLAHWLTARLRLEQELAADDWGARLSGGKPIYLASLARLALNRDTPATIWPARAFLPARGTFLRRIDMLRSTERLYPAALSIPARVLTVGLIAAVGVAVAGLRVSAGTGQPASQEAAPQPADQKTTAEKAPGKSEAFDLAYLPADTKVLVVLRPGPLLAREGVKSLIPSLLQSVVPSAPLAVAPEDIEQLAVFWEGFPEPPDNRRRSAFVPRPTGFVFRARVAQDWKARLDQIHGPTEEFLVDGQKCFRLAGRSSSASRCAYAPDDRTLVLTREEDLLRELVLDRKAPQPTRAWDRALARVSSGQAVLAVDSRWLRRRTAQGFSTARTTSSTGFAPTLETISPLFEKTRAYAISVGAFPTIEVDVIAETAAEADAKPVAETLQAVVTLGRNSVQSTAHNSDRELKNPALRSVLPLWESLLNSAQVESSANMVHMQAKSSLNLSEAATAMAPA